MMHVLRSTDHENYKIWISTKNIEEAENDET